MVGVLIFIEELLWYFEFVSTNSLYCTCADRPIASIAFHGQEELLAVASGHKVLIIALGIYFI